MFDAWRGVCAKAKGYPMKGKFWNETGKRNLKKAYAE
jgi:hypothetical protein